MPERALHAVYPVILRGESENPKLFGIHTASQATTWPGKQGIFRRPTRPGEPSETGAFPEWGTGARYAIFFLLSQWQDFKNKSCGLSLGSLQWAGMLGKEGRTSKNDFSGRSRKQETSGRPACGVNQDLFLGRTRVESPLSPEAPWGCREFRFFRTRLFHWFSAPIPQDRAWTETRSRYAAGTRDLEPPSWLGFKAERDISWGIVWVSPLLTGLTGPKL